MSAHELENTMKRRILLSSLVLGVVVVAVIGWTLEGLRWTVSGSSEPHPALG
jgi:hypothetical protein